VKDNGKGIQTDYNSQSAMGLKIVDMVTRKMKGFYEMRNNDGLQVNIQLPMS
jgi:two-component sensor histidine kinase